MKEIRYLILLIITIGFINCTSTYEKGKEYIEEKEWELAKETLALVSINEKDYNKAQELISIAEDEITFKNGNKSYEIGNFIDALKQFNSINDKDRFKSTTKSTGINYFISKSESGAKLQENICGTYFYHDYISPYKEVSVQSWIYDNMTFETYERYLNHLTGEYDEVTCCGTYTMRRTGVGAKLKVTGKYSGDNGVLETTFAFYKDDKNEWVLKSDSGKGFKNIIANKTD